MKYLAIFLSIITVVHADEYNSRLGGAMAKLESAFVPISKPYTLMGESTPISDFNVTINNKWMVTFKGNQSGTLNTIAINLDGYNITQDSNIPIQPNIAANYLFADKSLNQVMSYIGNGYKYLGAYAEIKATQFSGFSDFKMKKLQLILTWTDNDKVYHQDISDFILVFAK